LEGEDPMKTLLRIALLIAATLILAGRASAQTVSSSFQVTASVAKKCVIDATPNIAITTPASAWDPTSGTLPTPASATIILRCTKGTSYTIHLNGDVSTGVLTRSGSTDTLPFKLYDADCATEYTAIPQTAPSRAAQSTTICAGLDPAQAALLDTVSAGDYSKTIAVDVTF
jgi:spore coat protein U-like protein